MQHKIELKVKNDIAYAKINGIVYTVASEEFIVIDTSLSCNRKCINCEYLPTMLRPQAD